MYMHHVSNLALSLRNSCGVKRRMTDKTRTRFGLISLFSKNCKMTLRKYCRISSLHRLTPSYQERLTSRLTSSSSAFGFGLVVFDSDGAGLSLVSKLSRLFLSLVGVPAILSDPGVGLVIPDPVIEWRGGWTADVEDGPDEELDDQNPTPGLRDRSINWTDDWTLRISSRNVRFVWRSCVERVFDSSS